MSLKLYSPPAQGRVAPVHKQVFRWRFCKKGKNVFNHCVCLSFFMMFFSGAALANPVNGVVVAGSATISTTGKTLTIEQHSARTVIDWKNFDIAAGETTQFIQPNAGAVALNRVVNSTQASVINGNLVANGKVWVINPNGVLIGATGHVDVAGFIATSADIANKNFMSGANTLQFNQAGKPDAVVENKGRITIADEGLGLLVAPTVRNDGVIEGRLARLQLGAGDIFGVDLYGDGLLQLAVTKTNKPRNLHAENTGSLIANAGRVLLTAASASHMVNTVINTSGVIEANNLVAKGGEIVLTGAGAEVHVAGYIAASGQTGGGKIAIGDKTTKTVSIDKASHIEADAIVRGNGGSIDIWSKEGTQAAGNLSARGGALGGNGGFVETSALETLDVAQLVVKTDAPKGAYGTWLLDPTFFDISAVYADSIKNAASNILISGSDGIIFSSDVELTHAGVGLSLQSGNGGILMHGHTLRTNGGAVSFVSMGKINLDNAAVYTGGGDISFSGDTITSNNLTAPSLYGSTVCFATGGGVCGGASVQSPLLLTITAAPQTKTYGAADPVLSYSFSSDVLVQGDYLTGSLSRVAGEGAGSYAITQGTLSVDSVSGTPYSISFVGNNFVITPALLTLTALDQSKAYGAQQDLNANLVDVSGLKYSDKVTGVTLQSTGAKGAAGVGGYVITSSNAQGIGLSNYNIQYKSGLLTVTPTALTIQAQDQSKTYGQNFSFTGDEFTHAGTLYNGDAIAAVDFQSGAAEQSAQVGQYEVTPSHAIGTGLQNYTVTYAKGFFNVAPAALTITALDQSKTYGGGFSFAGNEYASSALYNGDKLSSVALSSIGSAARAHVKGYAIAPSNAQGVGLDNYDIHYVSGTLHVLPAALTITAQNQSKTYGADFAFDGTGLTISGTLYNDDYISKADLTSAGAVHTAPKGRYEILAQNAHGKGLPNYTIHYQAGHFDVLPASLLITAHDQSKTYGTGVNIASSAFTTTGTLYNDDAVTAADLESAGAAASAVIGRYAIVPSGAQGKGLSNYVLQYQSGQFKVNPAALTITALNQEKLAGVPISFSGQEYAAAGALYNGDSVKSVALTSAGAGVDAEVGDYAIVPSDASGLGLSNYVISYVTGILQVAEAPVITAPVSISAENDSFIPVAFYTQVPPPKIVITPAVSLYKEQASLLTAQDLAAIAPAAGGGDAPPLQNICANYFLQGIACAPN